MLVVTSCHPGDYQQTLRQAEWIAEMGGCRRHQVLFICDDRCDPGPIQSIYERSWGGGKQVMFTDHYRRWPQAPNAVFATAARIVASEYKAPWLFLEPDAIPLVPDWLDRIEAEYEATEKPFLGDLVHIGNAGFPVPPHMSGNAVYPADVMEHAGTLLLADNEAFDVVGADRVKGKMKVSKLILHRWKAPPFETLQDLEERIWQVKPGAVLFHADKTGSLYPLLRLHTLVGLKAEPKISCDIFIKSYPKDYEWLEYCLRSIEKFAKGFENVCLVSPESPPLYPRIGKGWFLLYTEKEHGSDGYLSQQVFKLYADKYCAADYILYMDSDTVFTREVTPNTFFSKEKINWMMTPYDRTDAPWQPVVEKFIGLPFRIEYEFMRRHPTMVPRWLLESTRKYCEIRHGMSLKDYVMSQPNRAFSEFNVLGAIAYYFQRDKFNWINTATTAECDWPTLTVKQHFSWDGLSDDTKKDLEAILG